MILGRSWYWCWLLVLLFWCGHRLDAQSTRCRSYSCNADNCDVAYTCLFGSCYSKFVLDIDKTVRYQESGCSDEFPPSVMGKCVGNPSQEFTCTCDGAKGACNADNQQVDPHQKWAATAQRSMLRRIPCVFRNDKVACKTSSDCQVTDRVYCSVGMPEKNYLRIRGDVDYVPHMERAAQLDPSAQWLCEEYLLNERWDCSCRTGNCTLVPSPPQTLGATIDRQLEPVRCRAFDSKLIGDELKNRTCLGHVCVAQYDRKLIKDGKDYLVQPNSVKLSLECRNFSHPKLFVNFVYNRQHGLNQTGQLFCRSELCNDFQSADFENISFVLRASSTAAAAIVSTFYAVVAVAVLCLFVAEKRF